MGSLTRKIFYTLPPRLRFLLRYAWYLPLDVWTALTGRKEKLTPPRRLIFTGAGDFNAIGNAFLKDFRDRNLITPASSILDVGSGIGRVSIPLTPWLTHGRYEGFDIMKPGIQWCQNHITSHYPHFRFTLINVANDLYKAGGASASDFTFPYPSASFDLAIALSVFTHMLPEEVNRYLSEIHRVLRPGGHAYATFFILNDTSAAAMKLHHNEFDFRYNKGSYSLLSDKVKSANVAYEETYLKKDLIENKGFRLLSLEYGSWSTTESKGPIRFQDTVVMQKVT